ncbi:ribosome small subunit-dependent GTPase A [Dehalogenimonas alkenigignens]|uniref:Small ribosomal subunit biogenesis GTPase RsgA n=1 Tax=Dehalogenimonas alkenigignens TaxID=1217799 RepID=A0A0W0GKY0_9CHLR|nr:ribosome small subunit-dependent GTPase A [Dehalogenimonas alkenigignens]KTB49187.1 ribosome small subunit-dependent GTPase A [Dehalogenimonas alkenigignens]
MNDQPTDSRPQDLRVLGWSPFFKEHFQQLNIPDTVPARVISESKDLFQVQSAGGVLAAAIAGRMRHRLKAEGLYPAAGDWVAVKPLAGEKKAVIQAVLPRKSKFSRKAAGERTVEQIVAANVDTVFIVSGLDGGRSFNLRRIERYLTLAWSSGAAPVMVLNKADVCPGVENFILKVKAIAPGVPVHAVSARERAGLEALAPYLTEGSTVAFLGSSGVGKSALINAMLGHERQQTGAVRSDDRLGRHTTTMRQLLLLPAGGIVIDTPGMREIQMWAGEDDLHGTFSDVEMYARECRYADCGHDGEPGCAVRAAIDQGELDPARLASYRKLGNEIHYLAAREAQSARCYEKEKWRPIAKLVKEINRSRLE